MQKKSISFCYPSSTSAKKFGFEKSGCYVVELLKHDRVQKTLRAFSNKEDAKVYADTLPEDYHWLYLNYN